MPQYSVKVGDIEDVVRELGGRAPYKKIYEALLAKFSSGKLPENYQDMATFQATVRRKVEDLRFREKVSTYFTTGHGKQKSRCPCGTAAFLETGGESGIRTPDFWTMILRLSSHKT
ncbi:hypothetical protein [Burkholderia orbicola]|uniref:hypothetical protein n=1 Tax=Burkholderia orbicola TaxID=2978683 RepID=UPI0026519E26|nr:hypothetical protein [Burkholderia orbicola]MDN7535601.1 hypothetical protein [Burkholderia orbicola]